MKKITETELFNEIKVFLLESNKSHLEDLKISCSKINNIVIDNSSFIRASIEYFFNNKDRLNELSEFLLDSKGFKILESLDEMLKNGSSVSEIHKKLGISVPIIERIKAKFY